MKRFLFPFFAIVILFAGCKLDEAGFPKKEELGLIIGKWYNKSRATVNDPGNIFTGFTVNDYIIFNSNKTATASESFTNSMTTVKYSVTGSTLTITSDAGEVETSIIKKLTTDSLILISQASISAGGTPTTFDVIDKYARK